MAEMSDNPAELLPVRVGCVYRPQLAPENLAATARLADELGLTEMWLWEDCFLAGGISAAAIALSNSAQLTVGVGVLPVPMRNVAATAMEIATLSRAFPGRVRIGIGHGVKDWMDQIGGKVESPMTLLREYLTCLRRLLRGERVTYTGRYVSLRDVCLDWPPSPDLEVLAAATGPRTLRLSGELADGTIISSGTSPEALRGAVRHIESGRTLRADSTPHSIVAYVMCASGPGGDEAIQREKVYWGYDEHADTAVFGDAAAIAKGARKWVAAGADTVVLQPTAEADLEQFLTVVSTEVQPLLSAHPPPVRPGDP